MDNEVNPQGNTTNPSSLAQIGSLTEAFSGSDFTTINIEEFKNDPVAAKIITILYAQSEKEKKQAEGKVAALMARVKYYQSIQNASIMFAVMSVIGTIVVGLGISLDMRWWIILLGSILVLGGEIMPRILYKKGDSM